MARTLVFSPHLDDAVLSIGNVLAGVPPSAVVVATVFAGTPRDRRQLRTFDERSGFASAGAAMDARRAEDVAALRMLGARAMPLGMIDGQYDPDPQPGSRFRQDDIVGVMLETLHTVRPDILVGPVGVAHPDHLDAAAAYRRLVAANGRSIQCWIYEELPGRVLEPQDVPLSFVEWDEAGFELLAGVPHTPWPDSGPKLRAIECYRSQRWALEPVWYPTLCPERLWQVLR